MKKLTPIVLLSMIIFIGAGCALLNQPDDKNGVNEKDDNNTNVNQQPSVTNTSTVTDATNWLIYTNNKYGFSFQYPNDWVISDKLFETYKKSYDNPRYQISEEDIVFVTELNEQEVGDEIEKYNNLQNETGSGIIESIAKGKIISIAVSEKKVSDLTNQPGFTFTIGDTILLQQDIQAKNVYLEKTWEGNVKYHYVYIPFQTDQTTNTGKTVESIVLTVESSSEDYSKNVLINIAKSFKKNS